ncbi:ubiquitin related modifier 1 [Ascodesmis nigricans]|uniref:Ubiquitin-related modifier 1 n=1 Tax=Ascodesmis nigricans TaxID=341454 RepID=A0A4S2N1W4_9PEZI|nr:ubiquitin related modifier 1 [Ascodesmis nigricans]
MATPLVASSTSTIPSSTATTGQIKVEFSGGLELLFANQRSVTLPLPLPTTTSTSTLATPPTVGDLVTYLVNTAMVDPRKELFVVDGAVRPGILVLINEADWELEGEEEYQLCDGDTVLFVSTLHGG